MSKYEPNGTAEEIKMGILHLVQGEFSLKGFYVSNEGTKQKPNFHVWVPEITHATCDSAYTDISLAVARCNYLAANVDPMKEKYQ